MIAAANHHADRWTFYYLWRQSARSESHHG
jgi:hypothetical protein